MMRRMTAARSLRSPAQRLSLSSSRSRRRLWSASVSSEPTRLRKAGSRPAGMSRSIQAFCASALAFASSLSARWADASMAKPTAVRGSALAKKALMSRGLARRC